MQVYCYLSDRSTYRVSFCIGGSRKKLFDEGKSGSSDGDSESGQFLLAAKEIICQIT